MTSLDSRKRWLVLAVIVAAQFMVVLDIAIVNVALPSIKTDLHFSQESLQWVITAYSILFGGVLLLGGRLADLLGRRRLFVAGLVLFTVSSLLDGFAWSEGSLIAFRSLQGLGAALLSPAALSILTTTFKEGRERNIALGIWGAASGSGGAAGVLLGGALTSAFNWSWIFFINVPAGAIVLATVPFLLRESKAELNHRHFDAAGAASITGGLMLLVYAMTRASQHGWVTGETIGLLAAAAALVVAFVVIELRSKAPLLPMRIFRLRTLTASNVSGLLLAAAVFSQFFLLTLYMQQVLHYSALKTGVAYITLTVSIVAFSGARPGAGDAPRHPAGADCRAPLVGGRARPVRTAAGARAVLLGSVPGLPAQRHRACARVRADVDRRPDRRRAVGCRHRVGADQHEPADRRRDRRCRGDDDRDDVQPALRARASRRVPARRCCAESRLPGGVLRARCDRRGRCGIGRDPDGVARASRLPSSSRSTRRSCSRQRKPEVGGGRPRRIALRRPAHTAGAGGSSAGASGSASISAAAAAASFFSSLRCCFSSRFSRSSRSRFILPIVWRFVVAMRTILSSVPHRSGGSGERVRRSRYYGSRQLDAGDDRGHRDRELRQHAATGLRSRRVAAAREAAPAER